MRPLQTGHVILVFVKHFTVYDRCPSLRSSPRRSPPSCLGTLSSLRLRRRVRNHDMHCRKLKPRQHRHNVAPALAFDHALLAGQGLVPRLRRRLEAGGRDDQAQRVCQVIVALRSSMHGAHRRPGLFSACHRRSQWCNHDHCQCERLRCLLCKLLMTSWRHVRTVECR